MAARVGALVLAVAMVVTAIFVRGRIDRSRSTFRLTCATELADACNAVGNGAKVTVEPAGVTADRLTALPAGTDPGLDAWLTPGPWPQIVDRARAASNQPAIFNNTSTPLAQTRLGLVVRTGVKFACAGPQWSCVGAGMAPLGQKAGIPDPAKEATGALVLAAMTAGQAVTDTPVLTLIDKLHDVDTRPAADAIDIALTSPEIDVVGTLDAVARHPLETAADKSKATLLYPQPVTSVAAVLATAGTGKSARRARDVMTAAAGQRALQDAGWDAGGILPNAADADVIAALRSQWKAQR